jgi:hypothetical protein
MKNQDKNNVVYLHSPELKTTDILQFLIRSAQQAVCAQTAIEYVFYQERLRHALEQYTGEHWTKWKI